MASMTCRHFHEELERYLDGDRSPAASAHLKSCAACSSIIADLKAIETEAHSWSAPLPEPPERVWVSLRNQLESEGIIKTATPETVHAGSGTGWWSRLFDWAPRPVLAGAYLAVLVAFSFGVSGLNHSIDVNWLKHGQIVQSPISAQLTSVETKNIAALRASNSAVAASLDQNLTIIDKQIALCEKSVSEEPDNEVARDFLNEAYHQKADLLTEISERGESGQ